MFGIEIGSIMHGSAIGPLGSLIFEATINYHAISKQYSAGYGFNPC